MGFRRAPDNAYSAADERGSTRISKQFLSAFIRVYRRPDELLQREFEVEDLFSGGGFVEALQVEGGVALQAGLEIEEAAGRLSGREHLRGQRLLLFPDRPA